jgi:hypothetical protein
MGEMISPHELGRREVELTRLHGLPAELITGNLRIATIRPGMAIALVSS